MIGWSSLGFWLMCQVPQFYKNWQNKSAAALSVIFLLEWFLGDALNLISSVLTGQLTTQIATASLFVSMDLFLCSQYFYYTYCYEKEEELDRSAPLHESLIESQNDAVSATDEAMTKPKIRTCSEPSNASVRLNTIVSPLLAVGLCAALLWTSSGDTIGARSQLRPHGLILSSAIPDVSDSSALPSLSRRQLSSSCDDGESLGEAIKIIGTVLAYLSASVYLTSRLPQMYKNYKRGSVEGLSPFMFLCAVMGNLTYALGVLVKSVKREDMISAAPFLLGSIGTIVFDLIILGQAFYFRGKAPRHRPHLTDASRRKPVPRGLHDIVDPMLTPFFSPGLKQPSSPVVQQSIGHSNSEGDLPSLSSR